MADYVTKNVVLEKQDLKAVNQVIKSRGLGTKGFSAAVRIIIREWSEMKKQVAQQSNTRAQSFGETTGH